MALYKMRLKANSKERWFLFLPPVADSWGVPEKNTESTGQNRSSGSIEYVSDETLEILRKLQRNT